MSGWPNTSPLLAEWGSSASRHPAPAARSRFPAVHSDSIFTCSSADGWTGGPHNAVFFVRVSGKLLRTHSDIHCECQLPHSSQSRA